MKINLYKIAFILIVIIGTFFRLYNLNVAPPQPNLDEVSNAYNAYSILKTGADEYGYKMPVLMRAYDDYRPAINVYATIPFVALLGTDPWAIRLPAAIISTITVVAVYFLAKELLKGARTIRFGSFILDIPLIVMLFFAVSPWDIYISRLGYEVNFAFSFLIFGILFFLRFVNDASKKYNYFNIFASAAFFGLSFGSYQSTKIVAPLIAISLGLLYWKKIFVNKKTLILSAVIAVIFMLPVLVTIIDKSSLIRFTGTSLLSNSQQYFEKTQARSDAVNKSGDLLGKVFDNQKIASGLLISHAYLSHLSPVWLFINEEGEQFKAPTMGLLYLYEFPLILLGLIFITRMGISSKNILFLFLWALIAIIPAAITTGYAHPLRIINILPVPQILSAIGLFVLLEYLSKLKKLKTIGITVVTIIFIYSVVWFYHSYFTLMPRELAHHFQYGVLNAFEKAGELDGDYKNVYVSGSDRLFGSYMYYLYINKVDPAKYQASGGTIEGGFASKHKIGKYKFGMIKYEEPNSLFILNPGELKDNLRIVDKIYYPDGRDALLIADNK